MGKDHLKRINAPRTWPIKRKGIKFITRPNPGQSSFTLGISLNTVIKDMLKIAKTTKEVKYMLNNQEVLVDAKRRKDPRYIIGFMGVLSFPLTKKDYRIILDSKGKIAIIEIPKDEAGIKLCKIIGKTKVKGKTQINLIDGSNIFVDKDEHTMGDTVIYDITNKKIKEILKLEKNCLIFLIGGKHMGKIGTLIDIGTKTITYKNQNGDVIETLKKFAYCIGKGKETIKVRK